MAKTGMIERNKRRETLVKRYEAKRKELKAKIADEKLPVVILNVSLGRAKPNPNVLAQMNETAQQEQRKKSLFAATDAEKQRELEQTAKARADNAYRNAMSLSPEQFIQLEAIKRYSEACAKSTCVIGQPGVGLNLAHK